MPRDEYHWKILKLLHEKPHLSQREIAAELGVSLGKANYCTRALIEKGLVKLDKFRHAENKRQYAYLLTPSGIEEKTRITVGFLRSKQAEYDAIKQEIEVLKKELRRA